MEVEVNRLHKPSLETVMMVEKTIIDMKEYPTRMMLWRNLPRKMEYQTFEYVLDYLEASGKITFSDKEIIYTGVDNPKLRALLESSVRVR